MKLGLFGGSFDPVHRGHVATARAAREQLGLERVLLLPTADPPHKPPRQAGALARFAMVEIALLGEEGLYASGHELTPGTTAYTVDTLEHFRGGYPDAELHYLLGSDSLADFDTWRRWKDILRLARLVVLTRPGWALEEVLEELPAAVRERLTDAAAGLRDGLGAPRVVERLVDVSSTDIRDTLAAGEEPAEDLLPAGVLDYIHKYGLYR